VASCADITSARVKNLDPDTSANSGKELHSDLARSRLFVFNNLLAYPANMGCHEHPQTLLRISPAAITSV
jgi:hypothetical protein